MGHIRTETRDRTFVITMDRQERKNALTVAMYEGLNEALDAYVADDALRVAIINGAGGVFTAGNDLQDFMNKPPAGPSSPVLQFLKRLVELDKPLMAAVRGPAIGIGTTMLLHTDFTYADGTAKFSMPFVPLGLVPEGGSSLLLPRVLGHRRAAELLMMGEEFGPEVAKEMGIINQRVVGDVLEHTLQVAELLAKKPPRAVREAKALMKAPYREELLRVVLAEAEQFGHALRSPEAAEAFRAFFEKREPSFD